MSSKYSQLPEFNLNKEVGLTIGAAFHPEGWVETVAMRLGILDRPRALAICDAAMKRALREDRTLFDSLERVQRAFRKAALRELHKLLEEASA